MLELDVLKIHLHWGTQQYLPVPRTWHRATLHPDPAVHLPFLPHAWFPREENSSVGYTTNIRGQDPILSIQELVSQGMPWQRSCCQLQMWLEAPPGRAHSLGPSIPVSNLTWLLSTRPHQLFKDCCNAVKRQIILMWEIWCRPGCPPPHQGFLSFTLFSPNR